MSMFLAAKRFKAFHGREPGKGEIVRIQMKAPADALCVGELVGVIYKVDNEATPYIHRFKKTARPVLYVSHDGKQLYALAGAYRFTDRGFEDASASAPKRRKPK